MNLEDLGYNEYIGKLLQVDIPSGFETGRVIAEHKDRYIVSTLKGDIESEITGNMRFAATEREDFPAVGDWVTLVIYEPDLGIIHKLLPRYSVIKRQTAGKTSEVQIIAANIDYAFLVQSADRDFNINRLERYLTICNSSGIEPVIVLTKIDLFDGSKINELKDHINSRIKNVPVIAVSNETGIGLDDLEKLIEKGKTYCMLGSSGVGKSTLLNNLSGRNLMKTGMISRSSNKGRHITSHRELNILDKGGIIIDNPGMREVGIADSGSGLEITFDAISSLSGNCRFKDCTHTEETGCAVLEAVEKGEIEKSTYENYLKMRRENAYFETSASERKKRERIFGKIVRDYKKNWDKKVR